MGKNIYPSSLFSQSVHRCREHHGLSVLKMESSSWASFGSVPCLQTVSTKYCRTLEGNTSEQYQSVCGPYVKGSMVLMLYRYFLQNKTLHPTGKPIKTPDVLKGRKTLHPPVFPLNTRGKGGETIAPPSGSPWNWADSQGPSFPKYKYKKYK